MKPCCWFLFPLVLVSLAFQPAGSTHSGPDDETPPKNAKPPKPKKLKATTADAGQKRVRWGQRRSESDADYDTRYAHLVKKIKLDKDTSAGGGSVLLWTYMGHPFIVRSDIDAEFTANTAMYMEMLHREYSEAYAKLLGGVPAQIKEKIEVVIFKDRDTYMKNGGSPGSGGQFAFSPGFSDRGPSWPSQHFRLMQFTNGQGDFSRWPKGVLKHEASHMELQMRLGMTLIPGAHIAVAVDCPRWWNEGHASVFEYWDFDKTVDENFAEIPKRGRYAPVIRRIHGTDLWKDFNYVWNIDAATWAKDMTKDQGFLNYAQAWSLAAYMMNEGGKGRKDFRAIFDLSKKVGADSKAPKGKSMGGGKGPGGGKNRGKGAGKGGGQGSGKGGGKGEGEGSRSWELAFPADDRAKMEKNWNEWVGANVSRKKRVPDEDFILMRMGYDPQVVERLEHLTEDAIKSMADKIKSEQEKRRAEAKVEK